MSLPRGMSDISSVSDEAAQAYPGYPTPARGPNPKPTVCCGNEAHRSPNRCSSGRKPSRTPSLAFEAPPVALSCAASPKSQECLRASRRPCNQSMCSMQGVVARGACLPASSPRHLALSAQELHFAEKISNRSHSLDIQQAPRTPHSTPPQGPREGPPLQPIGLALHMAMCNQAIALQTPLLAAPSGSELPDNLAPKAAQCLGTPNTSHPAPLQRLCLSENLALASSQGTGTQTRCAHARVKLHCPMFNTHAMIPSQGSEPT